MREQTVLMMDWVESVRHMAAGEQVAVSAWHGFLRQAAGLLAARGGQVVKSLGDGLLVAFAAPGPALWAAAGLHGLAAGAAHGLPMQLRISLHHAPMYGCGFDLLGHGVNIAARLLGVAQPCETVFSQAVRAGMPALLAPFVEDLGERFLKHVPEPVRVYRLPGIMGGDGAASAGGQQGDWHPSVALGRFESRTPAAGHWNVEGLLGDALQLELCRVPELQLLAPSGRAVRRGFELSGSYSLSGGQIVVTARLVDIRRAEVVWVDRLAGAVEDLCQPDSQLGRILGQRATRALISQEVRRLRLSPLSGLDSGALLLSGMALLHSPVRSEFALGERALDAVLERHRSHATPWAWSAWGMLIKEARGWCSPASGDEALRHRIRDHAQAALALAPGYPLAQGVAVYATGEDGAGRAAARARLGRCLEQSDRQALSWIERRLWTQLRQRGRLPGTAPMPAVPAAALQAGH